MGVRGRLRAVRATGLRRIALEIIGDTAYVVGLAGTIVEIDNL